MKTSRKLLAIPAIALAAGLGLAACTPGSDGPALTAGTATADQVCQSFVGKGLENTLTGQNTGTSIASYTSPSISDNLNGSGNEIVSCDYTLDTGADYPATVTLFANGSLGVTGR